jgi:hypothetical protein
VTAPDTPHLVEQWAALLDELGLGTYLPDAAGGSIFLLALPRDPAAVLAVTVVPGPPADGRHGFDEPTILVRVRGAPNDPAGTARRAQQVFDVLHGLGKRTLPGGLRLVRCFAAQAGPVWVGRDEQGRHEWSVSMSTEIRGSTINRR